MARELQAPRYCEPAHDLETAELRREVHRAIRHLSPKLRTVVVLYELQGLNYREIAMTLGCPLGTVKSRIFSARDQLKQSLSCSQARQLLAPGGAGFGGAEAALLQQPGAASQ